MKNKKLNINGSVSLFIAMIFLLVISVLTTTLLSARIEGSKAIISTTATLALDSVFAEYDRELFDEFGILLLDGRCGGEVLDKDAVTKKIGKYLIPSLEKNYNSADVLGIAIEGISINSIKTVTDGGGLFWMDEAVDYEKYAKAINLAADFLGIENAEGQIETIENIMDKMTEITDEMTVVNNQFKSLIEYVDGVEFQQVYNIHGGNKTSEYFLKKFRTENYVPDKLYIDSMISDYIVKVEPLLEEAYTCYTYGQKEKAGNILEKLTTDIKGVLGITYYVEEMFGKIDVNCLCISDKVEELEIYIDEAKGMLGAEIAESMCGDIQDMKDYKTSVKEKLCDTVELLNTMEYNKGILMECETILEDIKDENDILRVKELMKNYRYEGYNINHDFFRAPKSKLKIIETIKTVLKKGVLGIVIPEGDAISTRNVTLDDLASSVCNTDYTDELMENCSFGTRTTKRIVYGEYVMDSFLSYVDKGTGAALNYEIEYILNGKKSDVENLYETVKKLATLRSAVNMLYIMTDSDKKEDAYGLSKAAFGWIGVEGIVKVGQYLIMYLWSYAEGLVEVKALLSGWKILPLKNKDNWQLSFEDFVSLNLNPDEEKCEDGLKYEMYLRALLMFEDEGKKSAYTMDLVELWKIAHGDIKFRLRNYIFSIEAEIMYSVSGINKKYNYIVAESY